MNKIVLYAALALAAAVAVRASSEDIDGCQETLIACLNDSGAFFTVPASSEDPTDVTCGCQSASTTGNAEDNVNDGGCSCFCSCFNQYYTCYYTNVANSMIDAMKSAEDIITIGDTEYNISDYSPTDCIPTNSGSSSGEGTKGSGDNSGGHEDSDYNGDWCFFQYYGDPHLVSTTDGQNFDWWSCMMKNFTSIYQSSKLKVTGVGSALNGPKYLTYGTEITIEMKSGNSVTKTTVKASSMTFSNKTAPKGYVLGSCNRTVKNTPLTLLQSNKCVAMYSNTGEFMAIIQDGSSWTGGNFLMVEFYGPCDGQGNVQEGEGSCPSSRRVVRKVARSSPLCKGISAPYSEICNYDVSESGIDETSTSSYFASNGAKMAASYFHAINTLTGGVAAAAGLSAGAIAGIAIGATAGGLAVVGAATVVAVKVISGSKKEEPVETTERKKPTFAGAGPNVMDPDPLNHTSITARAPPVAV